MTTNSTVTSTSQSDKGPASTNANDQAELQEVIRISPTFRALSKDHIDVLIRTARIEHLPADRVVLSEGDRSERLYLILKGDVEAYWGSSLREIISRVTRGGVFGTVFEGEPSYCSFATSRSTLVASWDEATLRQAELRAPGLSFQLEVRLTKEKRLPEFNELLQHASLFRNTSSVLRQRLLHEMTLIQLPAGASIYQEGDSASACYLIVSGEVDVAQPATSGHEARSTRFGTRWRVRRDGSPHLREAHRGRRGDARYRASGHRSHRRGGAPPRLWLVPQCPLRARQPDREPRQGSGPDPRRQQHSALHPLDRLPVPGSVQRDRGE